LLGGIDGSKTALANFFQQPVAANDGAWAFFGRQFRAQTRSVRVGGRRLQGVPDLRPNPEQRLDSLAQCHIPGARTVQEGGAFSGRPTPRLAENPLFSSSWPSVRHGLSKSYIIPARLEGRRFGKPQSWVAADKQARIATFRKSQVTFPGKVAGVRQQVGVVLLWRDGAGALPIVALTLE